MAPFVPATEPPVPPVPFAAPLPPPGVPPVPGPDAVGSVTTGAELEPGGVPTRRAALPPAPSPGPPLPAPPPPAAVKRGVDPRTSAVAPPPPPPPFVAEIEFPPLPPWRHPYPPAPPVVVAGAPSPAQPAYTLRDSLGTTFSAPSTAADWPPSSASPPDGAALPWPPSPPAPTNPTVWTPDPIARVPGVPLQEKPRKTATCSSRLADAWIVPAPRRSRPLWKRASVRSTTARAPVPGAALSAAAPPDPASASTTAAPVAATR